jgi:hypothetical protein
MKNILSKISIFIFVLFYTFSINIFSKENEFIFLEINVNDIYLEYNIDAIIINNDIFIPILDTLTGIGFF